MAVTIFDVKVKSFWSKNMINLSTANQEETRNCELMGNQKYKNVVLAAIFCFANLKANGTKSRILSDRFELNTPKIM